MSYYRPFEISLPNSSSQASHSVETGVAQQSDAECELNRPLLLLLLLILCSVCWNMIFGFNIAHLDHRCDPTTMTESEVSAEQATAATWSIFYYSRLSEQQMCCSPAMNSSLLNVTLGSSMEERWRSKGGGGGRVSSVAAKRLRLSTTFQSSSLDNDSNLRNSFLLDRHVQVTRWDLCLFWVVCCCSAMPSSCDGWWQKKDWLVYTRIFPPSNIFCTIGYNIVAPQLL